MSQTETRLRIRLVAVDLDGTLLGPDHRITARNAAAIASLRDRGVACVIASGRMHEATTAFANELGLTGPIISYNGGMVRDLASGETWYHRCLPADAAAEVIDYCAEHHFHLNFYADDLDYVAEHGQWSQFYVRQTASPVRVLGSLASLKGTAPTKLILIDTPEVTDRVRPYFEARFGKSVYITKSNPEYLEFMHPEADKGIALAVVAEHLGIPCEETAAFGDGDNDIPMLRWAALGVAMGQASERVKAAADAVAPGVGADGLAEFVERELLR